MPTFSFTCVTQIWLQRTVFGKEITRRRGCWTRDYKEREKGQNPGGEVPVGGRVSRGRHGNKMP